VLNVIWITNLAKSAGYCRSGAAAMQSGGSLATRVIQVNTKASLPCWIRDCLARAKHRNAL
jgi:hypothetical protein